MKILTVIGARPQFVKASVVSRAIGKYNLNARQTPIQEILVHTGQHFDDNMSAVFFREMEIPQAQHNLGINNCNQGAMTGRMLEQIESVILNERPDLVLVYGDTNSTLAGALAAAKLNIPVAHVEAGLRSFNKCMPEEINRILTDHVSQWLFCPTETAVKNLTNEGFEVNKNLDKDQEKIFMVGDVMLDAVNYYKSKAQPGEYIDQILKRVPGGFYLSTIHRSENTDDPNRLKNIIESLEIISDQTPVILPLHPRTRAAMEKNGIQAKRIIMVEPLGYFDMISLLSRCIAVFTDSGGLQKEAYFFEKPCVTLRQETEWTELVDSGFNILSGTDVQAILNAESELKKREYDFSLRLYGSGNAGESIIKILVGS